MKRKIIYTLALLFATTQTFAQTYTYDNLNRLTKVIYDNGTIITYSFDALGNRTGKKVTTNVAFVTGDADGDGTVDVNDVTTTINYILKKPYTNFIMEAADVDGDKTIDVNDVQGIIDIALGKAKAAARKMEEE